MARPQPPQSPSVSSKPILIEIPTREFTNHPSSPPRPHPPRPKQPLHQKLSSATKAREASLQTLRYRCKHHVEHVVTVANSIKQRREQTSTMHAERLTTALRDAEERRRRLQSGRAARLKEVGERRARILRERERHDDNSSKTTNTGTKVSQVSNGRLQSTLLSSSSSVYSVKVEKKLYCNSPLLEGQKSEARHPTENPIAVNCPLGISQSTGNLRPSGRKQEMMSNEQWAAERIAAYYVLQKARMKMTQAGVLGAQICTYSFADVTKRLEDVQAQRASDLVFRALGMRRRERRLNAKDLLREKSERRVLLSCLLVALHPDAVMEDKARTEGSIDTLAVHAARRLLLCLHVGTLGALADAWVKWKRTFVQWKKNDKEQLLKAMIEDAVATEALRAAVDRRFAEVRDIDDFRVTLGASDAAAGLHRQEHTVWQEQINLKQKKTRQAIVRLASSVGEQRLDAALAASRHIGDEHLVHEILVDLPGLFKQIQESSSVPDSRWEQLRVELHASSPRHDELAARLAQISGVLNSMVDGCFVLSSAEVPYELDINFALSVVMKAKAALERCQSQRFDDALTEWVDAAVRNLHDCAADPISTIVDILKELSEFVCRIQTDVLSYRIRHIAPVVQQYGPAWERSHFQGHIMSGKVSKALPRTRSVLAHTLESLGPDADQLRSELRKRRPQALRTLLSQAIAQLVMMPRMCTQEDIPEVMHLDLQRLIRWQNEAQKLALIASLDNVGRQFLHQKNIARRTVDMKDLIIACGHADSRLTDIQESFVGFIQISMSRTDKSLHESEEAFLRKMVERMTRAGEKTFDLLHKRVIKSIVRRTLDKLKQVGSDQDSSSSSGEMGLEAVEKEVDMMAKGTAGLVSHLMNVHGESLLTLVAFES